ncbi:hypothetical protein FE810_08480 [Thalassotalea litorea]|uniref:Uncharacterized protein n=1 Tax=Thalassotalea litorea TaxID=2020715 RepID=A0A5R9IIH9_9GAMM|nr:hypothetical protein [Thalassotalea litorea]TLU65315.1 hypothetical protein FE810_08480 [Thalassotalea litorea]
MTSFQIIVLVVGVCLLLLGGFSGIAIFIRALKISDKFGDETNVGSLWGLFMLGIAAGLLLTWWALRTTGG